MTMLEINKVHNMDCLEGLKQIDDNSIDCCITSPPYWALRDYGIPGQIGLEKTPGEYISKLCNVFDEVKRILKPEGTLWVNINDTYASDTKGTGGMNGIRGALQEGQHFNPIHVDCDVPDKCQCDIPGRFSWEMITKGWIKRNTIIWLKPNCMPSPIEDRFTVDYEYLFFFVKNRKYYFDTQYEGKHKKRCVWSITTKPFNDEHYAGYPRELVDPCIRAGCPIEGIVLDPFIGTGTTGEVALKLNRNFIGFDINPKHIGFSNQRIFSNSKTLDMFVDKEKVIV
jgi:site-specific DNA-methyltransferase (adenine-specific)